MNHRDKAVELLQHYIGLAVPKGDPLEVAAIVDHTINAAVENTQKVPAAKLTLPPITQDQERKLFLADLEEAISDLYVVEHYAQPSDDQINLAHVRKAMHTLQNLKRRMEA